MYAWSMILSLEVLVCVCVCVCVCVREIMIKIVLSFLVNTGYEQNNTCIRQINSIYFPLLMNREEMIEIADRPKI